MEQNKQEYKNIFTIEERKKIIAQSMRDRRTALGLSQKEVAAKLGISQATYSAYERGRNEPPAETLVRLSYLFDCTVDFLIQRNRLYRSAEEALALVAQLQAEIMELKEEIAKAGYDSEKTKELDVMLDTLRSKVEQATKNPEFADFIEEPLK